MDDPKFRDYQNRLNLLLSHPGVLKNMSKGLNAGNIYHLINAI